MSRKRTVRIVFDDIYEETCNAINKECSFIKLKYSSKKDGRLDSANLESKFLNDLQGSFKKNYPSFDFEIPKNRHWYDVKINNIPINLKITSGGRDNAFNKVSILYTICGEEIDKKHMNFNSWWDEIEKCNKKDVRDKKSEYHYLVVDKNSSNIMFKSILDISEYHTNPCNILQIDWKNEFNNMNYSIEDKDFKKKINILLKTIQTSVKQDVESKMKLVNAKIK